MASTRRNGVTKARIRDFGGANEEFSPETTTNCSFRASVYFRYSVLRP